MNATVQAFLVAVIVAAAMGYATLKFMPAAWRRSLATHVAAMAARSGLSEAHSRRVEAKLASGGACGSCDSCRACATSVKKGDDAISAAPSPASYRHIQIRPVR